MEECFDVLISTAGDVLKEDASERHAKVSCDDDGRYYIRRLKREEEEEDEEDVNSSWLAVPKALPVPKKKNT